MKLSGRCALVTGGAQGIGRGCALELARAGAAVALNDRDDSPELAETIQEIRALGVPACAVPGDIFHATSAEQVVQQAIAGLGQIDVLISNPAYSRRNDFLDYPLEMFEQVLQGTLISGFYLSRIVAQHMVAQKIRGKLIFISSVHARVPYVRSVAYNAAKAGLNHMARTIAAELLPHRINVNLIEPGWIDTPGERRTFGDKVVEEEGAKLPWGRLGTPEDIGRTAVFLASADADYITGASLVVDGGFVLKGAQAD